MKSTTIHFVILVTLLLSAVASHANTIDFLFGAGSFGRKTGTTGDCRNLIKRYVENRKFYKDETWKDRVVNERAPNYLSDIDYMDETKYTNSTLGIVDTKYVPEFDTQIYYTPTAKPLADGTIPVVDPEAKALVIYFHGSGTKKASGVGFAGKMNSLSKMGYSSLSFDLPFHQLGSMNPALANSAEFAAYVERIVQKYKVAGQPVILVGHSFGPDIISEYITRYPKSVDAAVLVSPGSFDKTTSKWYSDKTSKMDFGDTEMNEAGGRWAGAVTNGKTWDRPGAAGRVDPTKANPDLDIYVISGDREEYVPGELDAVTGKPTTKPRGYDVQGVYNNYFSRVDVRIEPGVGHYIFNHRDDQGQDVVLRSILRANDESLLDEKELRRLASARFANRPSYETVALRYQKEPFFKTWLDQVAKEKGTDGIALIRTMMRTDDKKGGQDLLVNYMTVERQRMAELNAHIRSMETWAPDFYKENKVAIDALGDKGADSTVIQAKYLAYIKSLDANRIAANTVARSDVYVIAEKPVRPEGQVQAQAPQGQPLKPQLTPEEKDAKRRESMLSKGMDPNKAPGEPRVEAQVQAQPQKPQLTAEEKEAKRRESMLKKGMDPDRRPSQSP
jgi:pimeloyl-ACP methyl ester carboxylesterase